MKVSSKYLYSITIYSRRNYPGLLVTKINQDQHFDSKCQQGNISTSLNSPVLKNTQSKSQPGLTP